jgi:XTP/dITP diphosphohydrolase
MIENLFFASSNPGKAEEAAAILTPLGINIKVPKDFPGFVSPEETGRTFIENARIKARAGLLHSSVPTFGEDAGLEVTALDLEPGLYSSRYKGDIPQHEKNLDIIKRLDAEPGEERTARFHAVVVLCYDPEDPLKEIVTEGFCYGIIAEEPAGNNGFGYDPIMYIPELSKTLGQVPLEIKNRISHRRNALEALKERLLLLGNKKE